MEGGREKRGLWNNKGEEKDGGRDRGVNAISRGGQGTFLPVFVALIPPSSLLMVGNTVKAKSAAHYILL